MLSGFTSVSGLRAQSQAVDVIANNIANVNTTGFKRSSTNLRNTPPSPNGSGQTVGTGVNVGSITQSFSQGPIQFTGMDSDLAIDGPGFFTVQDQDGIIGFTRSGNFTRDSEGFLRTPNGGFLMGEGGRIQVPSDSSSYSIDRDGSVRSFNFSGVQTTVGTISLTNFPNENGLTPLGSGLFSPTDAAGDAVTGNPGEEGRGTIQSGALEMSNVDMAEEMVDMIVAQRSFEANVKVVQTTDEMLKTLTNLKK
jgi:flagellar basal-body rod protein FlgF